MKAGRALLAALCGLVLLSACHNPAQGLSTAHGQLKVTTKKLVAAKSILPDGDSIASYSLVGAGPSGTSIPATSSTDGIFSISDLVAGSWLITVEGLDSTSAVLATGSATVDISGGSQSSVAIMLAPASGNGTLALSATWPSGQSVDSVTGTLTPEGGSAQPISLAVSGASASYSTSIPAGSYILILNFYNGASMAAAPRMESVLVYAGKTSTGSFALTDTDFAIVVVTGVSLNKTETTITKGLTEQLTAIVTPANASMQACLWSSSDEAVATVDQSGFVTAVSGGSATITATTVEGGKTASCDVTVYVAVSGVALDKASTTIFAGETDQLTATVSPLDATNKSVVWSSDDTSVATVSGSGSISGIATGAATITATTIEGGFSAGCVVTVEAKVKSVSAGWHHTLIVKTDGTLWATGENAYGKLGDGTTTDRTTFVKIMGGVAAVSAGGSHTMILKLDGTLWATGRNTSGQLGDGTTIDRSSPVQVMSGVAAVAAGIGHTIITKTDGTTWTTGDNYYGQLGGAVVTPGTPIQVSSGVVTSAGEYHSMILTASGDLWAAGSNGYGQLGDGTTTTQYYTERVMTEVAAVSAGWLHTMIIKNDSSLWATGRSYEGQLGDGSNALYRLTPLQVLYGVAAVSAGGYHTLILKTDETLWATGDNSYGQLGGTISSQGTPIQIMNGGVASISAGWNHSMIVKTDGSLWAMGANAYGQLGDGTTTDIAVPVQVLP